MGNYNPRAPRLITKNGFCKHRFSLVKRFQEDHIWYAIQRCRWCQNWSRLRIDLVEFVKKTKPIMKVEMIELDRPIISTHAMVDNTHQILPQLKVDEI